MKNKWIKILLAASLALNVAFALTLIFREAPAPEPPWKKHGSRFHERSGQKEITLRKPQRKEIGSIFRSFRREMLEHKQNILDQRIAIVEALSDSEFNPEEIQSMTAELNKVENKLNILFVDALVQVNHVLDADQRLNFLLRLSKGWFFIKSPGPPRGRSGKSGPEKRQRRAR